MPVPSTIADLDPVAANNFPASTDLVGATIYTTHQAQSAILKKQFIRGNDIAVTATGVLTLPIENNYFVLSGTGFSITGFSTAYNGREVKLRLPTGLTLVHGGSLVLSGGYNRVTTNGDIITLINDSSGVWREVNYTYVLGVPRFKIHRNGVDTNSFAGGSATKVGFTTESFDPYGIWDTSTSTGTIQEPGEYQIEFQAGCVSTNATAIRAFIFKNGSAVAAYSMTYVATINTSARVVYNDAFAVGDTIEFKVQWDAATNFPMYGNPAYSWASLKKISV